MLQKITTIIVGLVLTVASIWAIFLTPPVYLLAFPIVAGFLVTNLIKDAVEETEIYEPKHACGTIVGVWFPLVLVELFIVFALIFDFTEYVVPVITILVLYGFISWAANVWIEKKNV